MVPAPWPLVVDSAAPESDIEPAQPAGHGNTGKLAVPAAANTPLADADGIIVLERADAATNAIPIPTSLLNTDVFISPPMDEDLVFYSRGPAGFPLPSNLYRAIRGEGPKG